MATVYSFVFELKDILISIQKFMCYYLTLILCTKYKSCIFPQRSNALWTSELDDYIEGTRDLSIYILDPYDNIPIEINDSEPSFFEVDDQLTIFIEESGMIFV